MMLRGGVSIGREVTDDCDTFIAGTSLTENPSRRNCHRANPFQPRWSALGVYTVPKVDVVVSGTFMSRPGSERIAERRRADVGDCRVAWTARRRRGGNHRYDQLPQSR